MGCLVIRAATPPVGGGAYTADYENDFESADDLESWSNSIGLSTTQAYSGTNSVAMTVNNGSTLMGAARRITATPAQGDEVWFRIRTFFPNGFNFTASPALKFMRIDTGAAPDGHGAHTDIYLCGGGSGSGSSNTGYFQYIEEGTQGDYGVDAWLLPGGTGSTTLPTGIVRNQWQTFEVYYKLHRTEGQGIIRLWRDNTLLINSTARPTLSASDAIIGGLSSGTAQGFMFITYWNGSSPAAQTAYTDDWKIVTSLTDRPTYISPEGHERIGP